MEQTSSKDQVKGLAIIAADVKESYPFRSAINGKRFPKTYEVNTQPSKTLPDQTLSIKEILKRYASGLPLDNVKVPVYDADDTDFPANWDKMDISERMEFKAQNEAEIKAMQQELSKPKEKPKKAAQNTSEGKKDTSDAAPSAAQGSTQEEPKK